MQTIPGQRSDVFIFYPQAGAFVGYLVEEYHHETMADFLTLLNKGRSIQDAFEIVFNKPLYEVENEWRSLFNAAPLPIPTATIEPSKYDSDQSYRTSVPLIDYANTTSGNKQPTPTTVPSLLPTVTPKKPSVTNPTLFEEKSDPDYIVASLVIGLSIIVGVWLFTSRRKPSKR
jgi:hypothetical protein